MANDKKYYLKIGNTYITYLSISNDEIINGVNASSDKIFAKMFDYSTAKRYSEKFRFEYEEYRKDNDNES